MKRILPIVSALLFAMSSNAFAAAQIAYIYDYKTAGTDGGTCSSGSWSVRDLNSLNDPSGIVSAFSSNQFSLGTGNYLIDVLAPASAVDAHRAKIIDASTGNDVLMGTSATADSSNNGTSSSAISGLVSVTSAMTLEVRHQCATTKSGTGYGVHSGMGTNELYTIVRILKI